NIELAKKLQRIRYFGRSDSFSTFRRQQRITDFYRPERRNYGFRAGETIENLIGPRGILVREAPRDCNRGVQNEGAQYLRPSWISWRIVMPRNFLPSRSRLISSITALVSR